MYQQSVTPKNQRKGECTIIGAAIFNASSSKDVVGHNKNFDQCSGLALLKLTRVSSVLLKQSPSPY